MSPRTSLRWACLFLLVLSAATPALAEETGKYREFRLGSAVASVLTLTGSPASSVKTVHDQPALLQVLEWRPRYGAGRTLPDVDPVRDVVFSFLDDRLYQIAVTYDRARTAGLTRDDLIKAVALDYGAPVAAPSRVAASVGLQSPFDLRQIIALWERDGTLVSLFWSDYRAEFGLLVASQALEEPARLASAAAKVIDEREAPAREAAKRKKEIDDLKSAAEQTRDTNKGAFRP